MNLAVVRITAAVAGALLIVGLLLGFLPVTRGGVSCGSAFVKSDDAGVADFRDALEADRFGTELDSVGGIQARCTDARSGRILPAIVLLVLGGSGLVAAVAMGSALNRAEHGEPRT